MTWVTSELDFTVKSSRYTQGYANYVHKLYSFLHLCITLSIKTVLWTKLVIFSDCFLNNWIFC